MIEVGQILDKYELLEKVGQGGMAVVYRGLDRSLKRPVAIKVLHRHLAEHQEARDRFEREAHAVAKLHHENILEIFDFSGSDADESYIVTEFIDGQTLKDFISEHEIKFPEVGAMVALQVCRALGHAHGLGILHRDVKPENIMIRSDGVVKLMDFGIAQMVDLQRMTVTGQLLGSPAYMSPEHVEGRPLDFRTDVFSVGILLYQLVIGRLPFRGRNPHEILKRIAECEYDDPRMSNPRVGRELGGIIDRALARDPDDRFPDISEMLAALERYCEGSGLSEYTKELARFFEAPGSYEMALRERLLDTLSRRGRESLEDNRVAALELFNRVLTIDPDNEDVLREINRASKRQRNLRVAALLGGVVLLGGIAVGAKMMLFGDSDGKAEPSAAVIEPDAGAAMAPPDPIDAAVEVAQADPIDAASPAVDDTPDAAVKIARNPRINKRPIKRPGNGKKPKKLPPDAGAAKTEPAKRTITLVVSPRNSEYKVPGRTWTKIAGRRVTVEIPEGISGLQVRNTICCQTTGVPIPVRGAIGTRRVNLRFLPGAVTPTCSKPDIGVRVNKRSGRVGKPTTIPIRSLGREQVTVEFFHRKDPTKYFRSRTVRVRYKQDVSVSCPP